MAAASDVKGLLGPEVAQPLKSRIVRFMQRASTEITPAERPRLADLAAVLPAARRVYVAHTPHASFEEVIETAVQVQARGFVAVPHIAARRILDAHQLGAGLERLRDCGGREILLIAGDSPRSSGAFDSTLQILSSGILEASGMEAVAVAGHPEGHSSVDSQRLWDALLSKQAFADRSSLRMHIVTQFGFGAGIVSGWQRTLLQHGVRLPMYVGIAGPTSIAKLAHFAVQCGIAASLAALLRHLSAAANTLASTPDQHLLALLQAPLAPQILGPHFFAFGGAVETALWMQKIARGEFEVDADHGRFVLRG